MYVHSPHGINTDKGQIIIIIISLQVIGYSSNLTLFISPSTVGQYTCHVAVTGYKHIHVSARVYQRGPPEVVKTPESRVQYGTLGETVQVDIRHEK